MIRPLIAVLALVALPVAATAQQRCVSGPEAEAIALAAMPDLIRETGRVCAALPATSLLRRTSGGFIAKYQREADRAWPAARDALAKLAEPSVAILLQSDYARPLLSTLFVAQITARINLADCPLLDRAVTLLEPLPPRNTVGLVVAALQYDAKPNAAGVRRSPLPLCPTTLNGTPAP